jgi:hypothetical protein
VLDVDWAEDSDLPVFRASDVRSSLLSTGHLSLSLGLRDRVLVTEAYFNLAGITCVSAPRYKSEIDYYTPMRLEPQGGDWRLENFLRECLEHQPGETAENWESRVADLWQVAGDDASWTDLELAVDDQQVDARAFALGGKAFVRVSLPDCDLEIAVPPTRVARLPAFQRMTMQELQPVLDEWRLSQPRRS